jgi:hypothetical protein
MDSKAGSGQDLVAGGPVGTTGGRTESFDKHRYSEREFRVLLDPAISKRVSPFVIAVALTSASGASAQQAPDGATEARINNDISNPIHRLDFFLENMQSAGGATWTPKVRYERPFDIYDGWKIAPRVEFTAVTTNDGTSPPGSFATGLGDTQFQAVLSKVLDAREGIGFGLRFWAPTASDDLFGNGRWRMAPAAGYRYTLPEWSPDSYFQLVTRYQFDFAGDPDRKHTSNLQLGPTLNTGLPDSWSVAMFPSTDIRYNFMTQEWFVPFDVEVAKQWTSTFMTGIEIGFPLFETTSPLYKFKMEAHLAFRF